MAKHHEAGGHELHTSNSVLQLFPCKCAICRHLGNERLWRSTPPFAWGHNGVVFLCSIPFVRKYASDSADMNWGPLSVLKRTENRIWQTCMGQTLTSPSLLGTTTSSEIHPDGPSGTSSGMSSCKSSSSFTSLFSRNLNGTCWTIGFTDSSMCSLSSQPFKGPTPLNHPQRNQPS